MTRSFSRIGLVGLGLMGGSLAALFRSHVPHAFIVGIDPSSQSRTFSLQKKWIDLACIDLSECPTDLDIIFVCTPIHHIKSIMTQLAKQMPASTLITEIGSVKSTLATIHKNCIHPGRITLGHPMAGSEKKGITHASQDWLRGATYILISETYDHSFKTWLETLSFKTVVLSLVDHDRYVAAVSHLPYLIALATTHTLLETGKEDHALQTLSQLIGPGFKDTTRIAASSREWGIDITTANKENLLIGLDRLSSQINTLKQLLEGNKTAPLQDYLDQAKSFRDTLTGSTATK